jgi:hypothetical protein
MNSLPLTTQPHQPLDQGLANEAKFGRRETMIAAQGRWPCRAMQREHSLVRPPDDMDMRGTVIIRIDHDTQTTDTAKP